MSGLIPNGPGPGRPDGLLAIGLGANLGAPRLGPPVATLAWAAARLGELFPGLRLAPIYRTSPISAIRQPDYFNTVAIAPLPTPIPEPRRLLATFKRLEREAGRGPAERDAPRVLDIDLLLFGSLVCAEDTLPAEVPGGWSGPLVLPHPRLRRRLFVLTPLWDLEPELVLPPDGKTVAAARAELLAELAAAGATESQHLLRLP